MYKVRTRTNFLSETSIPIGVLYTSILVNSYFSPFNRKSVYKHKKNT